MMIRQIFLVMAMLAQGAAFSQFKGVLVEEVDNEGKVPGRTYRIYAELTNVSDQVFVVYGDSAHKLEIKSTKPFFQAKTGGALSKDANRKAITESDSLKYDSWVTIGATDNYDNNMNILSMDFDDFEKKGGAINCKKEGAWFCIPTDKQAFCKEDKRILLMQLTTAGVVTGQFSIMGKTAKGDQYQNRDVTFTCGAKSKK